MKIFSEQQLKSGQVDRLMSCPTFVLGATTTSLFARPSVISSLPEYFLFPVFAFFARTSCVPCVLFAPRTFLYFSSNFTFVAMVSMLLHSCAWIGLLTSIVRAHLCQNAPGEIWITKPYEQYKHRSETPGERLKLLA